MKDFLTYKKIHAVGHKENANIFTDPSDEIIIQEKIDGGNFRFSILNNKIIFGSRTQQLTNDEGEDINVAKGFTRCVQYVRDKLKDKDLSTLDGFIFYGECCIKHTINYDWEKIPPFLGFDILTKDNQFLSLNSVASIYSNLDLQIVPTVDIIFVKDMKEINDDLVPISKFASSSNKDMKAEGIVFKNYTKQIMAKYVRNEFKEHNVEAFGGTPKYNKEGEFDDAEVVFKFCTNPRIDKTIFKLVDEGNALDMTMTGTLIKRVIQDIYDENWNEILNSNYKLNLKNIRNLVALRCRTVLQQVMINNALNKV